MGVLHTLYLIEIPVLCRTSGSQFYSSWAPPRDCLPLITRRLTVKVSACTARSNRLYVATLHHFKRIGIVIWLVLSLLLILLDLCRLANRHFRLFLANLPPSHLIVLFPRLWIVKLKVHVLLLTVYVRYMRLSGNSLRPHVLVWLLPPTVAGATMIFWWGIRRGFTQGICSYL